MYVADQYAERSFYELFGFQRVYEGDEFPGFLAIQNGKRSLDFSARRPNYRATRMACVGSSSSTEPMRSMRSSRPVAPTAWSMTLSPSKVAIDSFAAWSVSSPPAG